MPTATTGGLTEAQHDLIAAVDDVSEHMHWEFDADEYRGLSTCGFAHVDGISGNSSFVRSVMSLADTDDSRARADTRGDGYIVDIAGLRLSLSPSHKTGYRLHLDNIGDFITYPDAQRLDARERLCRLMLERFRDNGYLQSARINSRMD